MGPQLRIELGTSTVSNNNIKSVPWEELPRTLKIIDFSFNALTEVGTIKHLMNLEELHLRNNLIEHITDGFDQLKKIRIINLRNNKLSKLPVGFELISSRLLRLNLSENNFNYENEDLNESLWNRLPSTFTLNLNKNSLFQLPCQLAGKIRELQAMDCKLQYICPQIYNKLFECIYDTYYLGLQRMQLNVAMYDKLKTLSFIPHTIYPKASPKEKPTDNLLPYLTSDEERKYIASKKYPEWSIIISDKETLRNTQRFPKMGKKLVYAFKKVEETENEQETFCKCCAYCKYEEANNDQTYMIEQYMMMDCFFSVVDEISLARNVNIFGQAGWPAGKWKALIRTRLCEACIDQLKTKAEEAQNNDYETSNKVEAKKQRTQAIEPPAVDEEMPNNTPDVAPIQQTAHQNHNSAANIFVASPDIQNLSIPDDGPRFGLIDITWIKYVLQQPAPINTFHEGFNFTYCYPSKEYLNGICNCHGLHFENYPFEKCLNFYGSNISGKTNLLTVKVNPDLDSGYRSLSYLITGSENSYKKFRDLIYTHIQKKVLPQKFYDMYHQQLTTFSQVIRECELYAVANLLQLNIIVFNYFNDGKWFLMNETWLASETNTIHFLYERPSILLSKTHDNFYNPVLAAAD